MSLVATRGGFLALGHELVERRGVGAGGAEDGVGLGGIADHGLALWVSDHYNKRVQVFQYLSMRPQGDERKEPEKEAQER